MMINCDEVFLAFIWVSKEVTSYEKSVSAYGT